MNRPRLLLVTIATIAVALTASAFRSPVASTTGNGSVASAMPMLDPRSGHTAVEVFDLASGKFAMSSGEISGPWHFMTETKLKDGRVLLAGGYADNDRATAQTWIYKPQ